MDDVIPYYAANDPSSRSGCGVRAHRNPRCATVLLFTSRSCTATAVGHRRPRSRRRMSGDAALAYWVKMDPQAPFSPELYRPGLVPKWSTAAGVWSRRCAIVWVFTSRPCTGTAAGHRRPCSRRRVSGDAYSRSEAPLFSRADRSGPSGSTRGLPQARTRARKARFCRPGEYRRGLPGPRFGGVSVILGQSRTFVSYISWLKSPCKTEIVGQCTFSVVILG